jgi:hypothetical protein
MLSSCQSTASKALRAKVDQGHVLVETMNGHVPAAVAVMRGGALSVISVIGPVPFGLVTY